MLNVLFLIESHDCVLLLLLLLLLLGFLLLNQSYISCAWGNRHTQVADLPVSIHGVYIVRGVGCIKKPIT